MPNMVRLRGTTDGVIHSPEVIFVDPTQIASIARQNVHGEFGTYTSLSLRNGAWFCIMETPEEILALQETRR
jgi:hypothetical protein